MINKNAVNYNRISSLEDLEQEMNHVRTLIHKQGDTIEKDWNEIYSFWSFVPKTARFAKDFIGSIPMSFSIISFLMDIFRKNPAGKKKSSTLNILGFLLDLILRKKK